jgi:excinuclease UvrABC nuclease subunit
MPAARRKPIRKGTFAAPYTAAGRTTFSNTKGRAGVYEIKENGKVVYVGFSGLNLYKTLYRHFEEWTHKTQKVVTYKERMKRGKRYTVRVTLCSPRDAYRLEAALIKRHKPRDNEQDYRQYKLTLSDLAVKARYDKAKPKPRTGKTIIAPF